MRATALVVLVFAAPVLALEAEALASLKVAAEASNSDAVVILEDGRAVAEWHFGNDPRPIEAMSVVKSLVAVGIGRLMMLGKIESLDQPVHTFFPEWKQGRKQDITLRHLMDHSSGLQNVGNTGVEIYPAPDALKLALAAELSHEPGAEVAYNNKAVNLLSGVIEVAYGKPMDTFFAEQLFAPMGIEEAGWYYDKAGRPHAMAGIQLHAKDLAKFGQLVLDQGKWHGDQLVSAAFIDEMLAQAHENIPRLGLLWWRHTEKGVTEPSAFYGAGYLGQYLVIVPATRIVAVRQIQSSDDYNKDTDSFRDFVQRVAALQ